MSEFNAQVDIRKYDCGHRYTFVYDAFDKLEIGEKMELINDHDPRPLFERKLPSDFPGQFQWDYIEKGPNVWRASIMKIK